MIAICDNGTITLHPIVNGRVDYDTDIPWPSDWPQHVDAEFLRAKGIRAIRT